MTSRLMCPPLVLRSARLLLAFILSSISALAGQSQPPLDAAPLYQQLQNSSVLEKRSVHLENVVLRRDRVTITFTNGIVYLSPPVAGKVRSAVFIGSGKLQATPPPVAFEQDNVRRLLKADDVSAEFKTAVLRFTDELAPRLLKETGMNISARQLESILNQETPELFLIQTQNCGFSRRRRRR